VDSPEQSDRVRRQYELPFPILCDTHKQVTRAWGLFNAKEKDGIAVPAILLLGRDRHFRSVMIEGALPASAPPTYLSFSALIRLLPILPATYPPMHSASASFFHRWWTSAAPSGIPSLSFNTLMI
jgi:AhpC/TSA family